ncbi:hypothetical protein BCR33DRAFT_738418 [Rhizoclosmatium globosum]|uniref:Hydrophobin n=1 Tax=Rhizoclosmatium globosum TaxID=329046 RepID=A0A1Y2C9F8_9FUNG|nr:hypothetical protein BCR33DRAFT_738418 [Rhizoclosmatium globosum]|eukprot:ORY43672.1 hypothetical protein BCR33DRAFT_738418 [Rhizoclosmatium globosum]
MQMLTVLAFAAFASSTPVPKEKRDVNFAMDLFSSAFSSKAKDNEPCSATVGCISFDYTCCLTPENTASGKSLCVPTKGTASQEITSYTNISTRLLVCISSSFQTGNAPNRQAISYNIETKPNQFKQSYKGIKTINDGQLCASGDICTNSNSVCCVSDYSGGSKICQSFTACGTGSRSFAKPYIAQANAYVIQDGVPCASGDTCANPSSSCCSTGNGIRTCRPTTSCPNESRAKFNTYNTGVVGGNTASNRLVINNWETCQIGRDTCVNRDWVCCVASADLGSNKATCRPQNDCGNLNSLDKAGKTGGITGGNQVNNK